jgi:hypothetical protein
MLKQSLNYVLPVMGLNRTDGKKPLADQEEKSADKKELLATTFTEGTENVVSFDDWNGLSMEDGMELKIIQPKGSPVC